MQPLIVQLNWVKKIDQLDDPPLLIQALKMSYSAFLGPFAVLKPGQD